MKYLILNNFKQGHDSDLTIIAKRVIDKMQNNPAFPHPPAALATIKKLAPEYEKALARAKGGDKEMIAIKNNRRNRIRAGLAELAEYVTRTAKQNEQLLLSSGFDITAAKKQPALGKIDYLIVELGQRGEATTRIKSVRGARAYIHEYTKEEPTSTSQWTSTGSSFRYYRFKGLQSEKRHWFRVIAIGPGNQLVYSPIVDRVIQ